MNPSVRHVQLSYYGNTVVGSTKNFGSTNIARGEKTTRWVFQMDILFGELGGCDGSSRRRSPLINRPSPGVARRTACNISESDVQDCRFQSNKGLEKNYPPVSSCFDQVAPPAPYALIVHRWDISVGDSTVPTKANCMAAAVSFSVPASDQSI